MRVTYPLVFTLFLSSCAGYQAQDPMHVAATKTMSEREPSSSDDEENLKIGFEAMMNSENPEKEFVDYLSRLKSIFVRAESNLADFDQSLDEAVTAANGSGISFESSKTYKKLIVMWGLKHRLQDKIIFHYLKLTDMSYDKSFPAEKRKMAKRILLKFKKKLDSTDPMEKITFDELKLSIAAAIKERRGLTSKSVNSADMPANNFKDDQEKLSVLRQYREKLRKMGKEEQASNDELSQTIDQSSEKLQFIDQAGREPQSQLTFYPSTGTNGNVMGLVFPKNVWALTFDDGPNPTHTPEIVKNLEANGVKATFFWLAENVVKYQSIVDLVKEKGMALANHSWSHAQLPKLDAAGLQKEIVKSTQVEAKSYGQEVKFFRCPYGAGNSVPRIRSMIADLDMIHVFWNVDTLDWQDKDPDSILARTKKQMKASGRGVVLFHDIHRQSVVASKKLVEWTSSLKGTESEIRWVTLPQIVKEMNGAGK